MAGFQPKIPMHTNRIDGVALTKNMVENVKQNLKMLFLTSPGERVMIPEFGIGLRRYLFEPLTPDTLAGIQARIQQQMKRYTPYVRVDQLRIFSALDESDIDPSIQLDENYIRVRLVYSIPNFISADIFDLHLTNGAAAGPIVPV